MRIFGRKLANENDYLRRELAAKEKDIGSLRAEIHNKRDITHKLAEENALLIKENKALKISQTLLKKKNQTLKETLDETDFSTIDRIRAMCKEAKGNVISKKQILKELGE